MDYIPNNPNTTGQTPGTYPQGNGFNSPNRAPSPAEIYNANTTGGTPQYHYGAPQNFFDPGYIREQQQQMLYRKHHEKKIKSLGSISGTILLVLLGISFIFSYLLLLPNFQKLYETNLTFSSAFAIFYSVISVGGAFFVGSKLFKHNKSLKRIPYNPPEDKAKAGLLILMGFGGCLIANYVTVFLRAIGEGMGIYSTYTSLQDPSSTLDVIMIFISSAIVPPLVEEFALRGVLLQSLRKYGDTFAIITSAFVFGIFHGNAVQIPFAFLCGLVIGYAVISTESLWTGIIIHALMNAMSGISSALIYYFDEYVSNTFFYVGSAAGIILGIIALTIYFTRYKNEKALTDNSPINNVTLTEKFVKFNTSPVMILAIILYAIQAITQLTTTPPTF